MHASMCRTPGREPRYGTKAVSQGPRVEATLVVCGCRRLLPKHARTVCSWCVLHLTECPSQGLLAGRRQREGGGLLLPSPGGAHCELFIL